MRYARFTMGLAAVALAAWVGGMGATAAETAAKPTELAKVMMKDSKVYVGEVKEESDTSVTIVDLTTGHDRTLAKDTILSTSRDISDDAAVQNTDLATVVAWKLSKLKIAGSDKATVGKVARTADAVIYLTLGADQNVKVGDRLPTFRNQGEIKDPDTGKVLGVERPRIAEIEVTEVQAGYSKAKLLGNLEVKIQAGDEVELAGFKLEVAVFPPVDSEGKVTDSGLALAEQLTTKLVNAKVPVVERARLDAALVELAIQRSSLFDAATAQKVGKQIGASAVLTGKIVARNATSSEAHVRLVNVQTGQIMMAASASLSGGVAVGSGGGTTASSGGGGDKPAANGFAPPEDKIIVEDEHEGHALAHEPTRGNASYLTRITPKDPLIKVGETSLYFRARCPNKGDGNTKGTVSVSIDYGKTWVKAYEWDTANMHQAARRDDWTKVDLMAVFRKDAAKEVDEVRMKFEADGQVEQLDISRVVWVRK